MIPGYKRVKLIRNLDVKLLGIPPESVVGLTEEEQEGGTKGLNESKEYRDLRGMCWGFFDEVYPVERICVLEAKKRCRNLSQVYDFFDKIENEEELPRKEEVFEDLGMYPWEIPYFELGIASMSIAISALGGAPVSSCRGHRDRSKFPFVNFWINEEGAVVLRDVVKHRRIGLENGMLERHPGATAYARDVGTMLNYAKALRDYAGKSLK